MSWLVWKEYRLNRFIMLGAAILLLAPHATALVLACWGAGPATDGRASQLAVNLLASALYSVILSQLTLALLGGNAIACEREDRSAEFLAYLPVSRTRILAGKITLALLVVALIWLPNLLILYLTAAAAGELPTGFEMPWNAFGYAATTGFIFFSVGWLLSSCVEKPVIAVLSGLFSPFLVLLATMSLALALGHADDFAATWYVRTCLTLGLACFVAGTWYYLRRVEP